MVKMNNIKLYFVKVLLKSVQTYKVKYIIFFV